MKFFDIDKDTMINLEHITSVRFDKVEKNKIVVVNVMGETFMLPADKHKEFFTMLVKMGIKPNNQFISL